MNEKKVREAIEDFQKLAELLQNKDSAAVEHCNTAIEALEKQLPKKPDIMDYILGDINFKCPTCKSEYICEKGYEHFYCPNCGQRLDWSE